jgi:hypothetical protein
MAVRGAGTLGLSEFLAVLEERLDRLPPGELRAVCWRMLNACRPANARHSSG